MKITALTENISHFEDLKAEHGLSLYIETNNKKILFDMGQTELFAENAEKLGIDLSSVDIAVLSHGHYDHGGGMKHFLCVNKEAPVYINRHAFGDYYNGAEKYIGLDKSLQESDRLCYTDGFFRISEGLTLYACNDITKEYDLGSFGLNEKKNGVFLPDTFLHEQYLLIEEEGKRVLISGCSHKGVLNIVKWFCPDVLVGGFHFSKLPIGETLKGYAEYLGGFDTDYYTCHCTGVEQYEFMKDYIKTLDYISVGKTLII